MNNNDDRYNNSGPIGTHKGISPLKIIFIILLWLIVLLAYKTYSKISGFLSFVSGEIDAVSSSIQHFGFSTSGPVSLDDENQNGMIIEDKSAAISRRRAKFMENLRKAQQAQKAGIMPKSSEKADEETRSKQ